MRYADVSGNPIPLDEHLYISQTQPYFRAPHIYVATPARLFEGREAPLTPEEVKQVGLHEGYSHDTSDAVFMSSRDGFTYDRTFREANGF